MSEPLEDDVTGFTPDEYEQLSLDVMGMSYAQLRCLRDWVDHLISERAEMQEKSRMALH
jgi:hypothetical protein